MKGGIRHLVPGSRCYLPHSSRPLLYPRGRRLSRRIPGTSVFLPGDVLVPRPTRGSLQSGGNALAGTLFPCTSYYLYPLLPPFRRCLPSVKRFFSCRRDTHARTAPEYIRSGGKQECWDGISVRLDLIRYYTAGSPSFTYIGSRGVPLAASQRRLHPDPVRDPTSRPAGETALPVKGMFLTSHRKLCRGPWPSQGDTSRYFHCGD